MQERFRFLAALTKHRSLPFLARFETYVGSLRPSDKAIVGILAVLLTATSLWSVFALTRSVMVRVPVHGGSLHEGVVGAPRFVNPLLALTDTDRDLTALTYAGLMGRGGDGTLVHVLAERHEVSENGLMYTFVLREGLTFSDGSPLTAEDVVFTIEKVQNRNLKSPQYANWADIKTEVLDTRTVRFTLTKPYALFLEDTTLGILPARLWRNVPDAEFPFSPLMLKPVGAGPFVVESIARDKEGSASSYTLKSFSDFALGKPYLATIRISFFETPSDLADALQSNKVESGYGIPRPHVRTAPYARIFGVFFNEEQNDVFSRLEIRKALSVAINREALVNDVLGGYAEPIIGPIPPGNGVVDIPLPPVATRIEDAKNILTDAKWTYDAETFSWEPPSGVSVGELSGITIRTSNVAELKLEAASIQADWEQLGIPVSVELYEPGDLTQNVIRPRDFEALLFGEITGRGDLYAFWASSEREDPGLNIAGYNDPVVDGLLARERTESDPEMRLRALQDASNRIAADYPAAFTHAPLFLYAMPINVEGVALPQITSPSDRFATVASWSRESQYVWPFLVGGK